MQSRTLSAVGATLFFLLLIYAAKGEPFRPQDPSAVLERLPLKPGDSKSRELRQLRADLAGRPNDISLATKLARRYFELVGMEGDPRYVGYAQAALSPWWKIKSPPAEILIVRASLKQYRHDFGGAIADLEQAIALEPRNGEALSLAATIHMVQGRYVDAREKCRSLQKLAIEVIAIGCTGMVVALEGGARQAHDGLQVALERSSEASTAQRLWVLTRLGEMAARIGDYGLAEKHFRSALSLGLIDGYLLAAYADLLLDQDRPAEVLALLKGMERSDMLLLRIALADKILRSPEAEKRHTELANRFQAAQMRGDKVHQAEEARFRLHLVDDSKGALALASENWMVQKEPRDARILLESAIAAKDRKAAEPVLNWMKATNIEDVVLRRLAIQFGVK
jgi:Tfp pilus assembly protein PilF